jgi:hypothetical protein
MGYVALVGELRNAYKISFGNPEVSFGRPRHRWENNIKIDLKRIGYKNVNWIRVT